MSAILLERLEQYVRAQLTKQEVATVQPYGGEFSAEEVSSLSFNAPAILITLLGWQPHTPDGRSRLGGRRSRDCRLAAFVVTKHAKRDARMKQAMLIAEKLARALRSWKPDADASLVAAPQQNMALAIAALEEEPDCENLYGRAIDKAGLALWLVSWTQTVMPLLGDGDGADGSQGIGNWLTLELESLARQAPVPAPATEPLPPELVNKPTSTHKLGFVPD